MRGAHADAPFMNTTLAIYEALIQANVPPLAARRAAEALEADMLTHLATKQDLAHLEQRVNARFDSLEAQIGQRIDALDERLSQRIDALDQRLSQRIGTIDQHLGQRIEALDQSVSARLAASHTQYDLKLQNLESRLVIKLGALLTVLLSAASTLQVLLR
jgi:DNA anti-recombination protein RmuC